MTRLISWAFWLSVFVLAVTVESWADGVPVTLAILAWVGLMTGIAVRWSRKEEMGR